MKQPRTAIQGAMEEESAVPRLQIRDVTAADARAICAIYNPYIAGTVISFEEEPVADDTMRRRIEEITAQHPWLVAEEGARIVGYAYAAPWHRRAAYRYTVESTIYLAPAAGGRGVGYSLYAALLEALKARGVRRVIGGIALPNPASVALHERLGFLKVGHFEAVGHKHGRAIDVGYWELEL